MINVPMPIALAEEATRARRMVSWGRELVYCAFDWVPVVLLVATQGEVYGSRVDELAKVTCPGAIDVAYIDGRYIIVEGHHRATVAWRAGWKRIHASVRSALPALHLTEDE